MIQEFGLFNLPFVQNIAPLETRWIFASLYRVSAAVNIALEEYRFDEAANLIYQFFWGDFCDWYLEIAKIRMNFTPDSQALGLKQDLTEFEERQLEESQLAKNSLWNTILVFESSLRLLSPFMPFLTEEIWHAVYNGKPPAKSIALARYPRSAKAPKGEAAAAVFREMAFLQSLITEVRALRKELGVEEKVAAPIEACITTDLLSIAQENRDIIERLAKVSEIRFVNEITTGLTRHSTPDFDVAVIYVRAIDIPAERERLTKEIAKLEKNIVSNESKLGNEGFLSKAPANIVEGLRKQQAENSELLAKAKAALAALG